MTVQEKIELWFNRIFNTHAVKDGTPPFSHYVDSFDKSDFGLAVRIEEGLSQQTGNLELFTLCIGLIILTTIIICFAITWRNQRKLKKELREIKDLLNQTKTEDKPQ